MKIGGNKKQDTTKSIVKRKRGKSSNLVIPNRRATHTRQSERPSYAESYEENKKLFLMNLNKRLH